MVARVHFIRRCTRQDAESAAARPAHNPLYHFGPVLQTNPLANSFFFEPPCSLEVRCNCASAQLASAGLLSRKSNGVKGRRLRGRGGPLRRSRRARSLLSASRKWAGFVNSCFVLRRAGSVSDGQKPS